MSRLLVPFSSIALLVLIVGCGGGGAGDTTGTTDGSTGTPTSSRAPAGTYSATLTGTRTTGEAVTGSGSATVASDGTITLSYSATIGDAIALRTLTAAVTAAGVATGTVAEGGTTYPLNSGNLVRNPDGRYTLTTAFTKGTGETAISEMDVFGLTATRPASGSFIGSVKGTDNKGATYSGTGILTLPESGNFTLTYDSRRRFGGVTTIQAHSLSTALGTDGTFTGTMTVATLLSGIPITVPVTGTWALNANGSVTLVLNYANTTYIPTPTVSETLTLARQ